MSGSSDIEDLWNDSTDYTLDTIELFIDTWFEIVPIALTIEQIREYNPPPNPAKTTDPRSGKFIAELGKTSWEVDALRPEVLNQLLEDEITARIDEGKYEDILDEEKIHIKTLIGFKESI